MIGGIAIVSGLFLAMCAWMAYDYGNQPGWGWVTIKYAVSIAAIGGVMLAAVWAWEGLSTVH